MVQKVDHVVFLDSALHNQPHHEILEDEKMELSPRESVSLSLNPLGIQPTLAKNHTEDVAEKLVGVMSEQIELREQLAEWKQQAATGVITRNQYKTLKASAIKKFRGDKEERKRKHKQRAKSEPSDNKTNSKADDQEATLWV